jgi:hypothetical protein
MQDLTLMTPCEARHACGQLSSVTSVMREVYHNQAQKKAWHEKLGLCHFEDTT